MRERSPMDKRLLDNRLLADLYNRLRYAINAKDFERVQHVIEEFRYQKLDYTYNCYEFGQNALHFASKSGTPEIVNYLLRNGFESLMSEPYTDGYTVYHMAAHNNNLSVLRFFLERFPLQNPSRLVTPHGRTILHACMKKAPLCFDYLLDLYKHDKDFINTQDFFGETVLHVAVYKNDLNSIIKLLEHAARRDLKHRGKTPLDLARDMNYGPIITVLQNHNSEKWPLSITPTNSLPVIDLEAPCVQKSHPSKSENRKEEKLKWKANLDKLRDFLLKADKKNADEIMGALGFKLSYLEKSLTDISAQVSCLSGNPQQISNIYVELSHAKNANHQIVEEYRDLKSRVTNMENKFETLTSAVSEMKAAMEVLLSNEKREPKPEQNTLDSQKNIRKLGHVLSESLNPLAKRRRTESLSEEQQFRPLGRNK